MPTPTTLVVGDLHLPFVSQAGLDFALKICSEVKPKRIIQIGDLYDLYAYSRFARSQNVYTPRQEVELGRKKAEWFWAQMRSAARASSHKKVECYQLLGNHDERLIRRTLAVLPEIEHIVQGTSLWRFENVTTLGAERDELVLDEICYMHGFRKHGEHVTYNKMSTVVGHTHLGGVVYTRVRDQVLFELNVGFLADTTSVPLSYTKQRTFSNATHGIGLIDEYGPRFIAMSTR